MSRAKRIVAWGLFTLTLMVLSGWLLADHFTPRAVGAKSNALPVQPSQTALDREVAPRVAAHGGRTAAILLTDGVEAFASRALSAREAGRSLDLQYYIWHNDLTGRLLAREAYLAAQRGVRVRMLLDDMNDEGSDAGLLALDAHPNIEIRLYNPFRNRTGAMRVVEMAQRIYSVNHRMHNKAWIADNRVAVLGGRNIGEAYFDASEDSNFRDLDLLLFGPKVTQASDVFDAYWNSDAVVPIAALADQRTADLDMIIGEVQRESASPAARRYLDRLETSDSVHQYRLAKLRPHWTHGIDVIADPPTKWKKDEDRSQWLVTRLAKVIFGAREKALLISPYFVPGDEATPALVGLVRDRKAHVGVVTNSLAANDVPAVHSGYAEYREALLAGGLHLYEIRATAPITTAADGRRVPAAKDGGASGGRPDNDDARDDEEEDEEDAGSAGLFGSSGASLHTKAFLVDDRQGFIGSFNLDPRSAYLNTEMGVLFDDRAIAAELRKEYLTLAGPKMSYWVYRNGDGDVRWLDRSVQPPRVSETEPGATLWRRVSARVLGWLPIESQL